MGLEHWTSTVSSYIDDIGPFDRSLRALHRLHVHLQPGTHLTRESSAVLFRWAKDANATEGRQRPANGQELSPCLPPASKKAQLPPVVSCEVPARDTGRGAGAPDIELAARYQGQPVAAFRVKQKNKIGIMGSAKKREQPQSNTVLRHRRRKNTEISFLVFQ